MANETNATQSDAQQTAQGQQSGAQQQSFQGSEQGTQQRGQEVQTQQERQGGGLPERRQDGLARYSGNPFALMQDLSREVDRLFDSFFRGTPARTHGRRAAMPSLWVPEVDVTEEGNQLRVCV